LIEAAGCTLLVLPPYSPDFDPIEPAWSKLRTLLRGMGARTVDALHTALAGLVDAIHPTMRAATSATAAMPARPTAKLL
jgi:transposase